MFSPPRHLSTSVLHGLCVACFSNTSHHFHIIFIHALDSSQSPLRDPRGACNHPETNGQEYGRVAAHSVSSKSGRHPWDHGEQVAQRKAHRRTDLGMPKCFWVSSLVQEIFLRLDWRESKQNYKPCMIHTKHHTQIKSMSGKFPRKGLHQAPASSTVFFQHCNGNMCALVYM